MSGVLKAELTNLRPKFHECENHLTPFICGSAINLKQDDMACKDRATVVDFV